MSEPPWGDYESMSEGDVKAAIWEEMIRCANDTYERAKAVLDYETEHAERKEVIQYATMWTRIAYTVAHGWRAGKGEKPWVPGEG